MADHTPPVPPYDRPATPEGLDALVVRLRKLASDMAHHATDEWDEHEDVLSAIAAISTLRTAPPVSSAMARFDLEQTTRQIENDHAALMHLCRKHGMVGELPLQWLDERLSAPPVGARVSIPPGLIDALRSQRQIDADGCEVAVSRQAVDGAIDILDNSPSWLPTALYVPPKDQPFLARNPGFAASRAGEEALAEALREIANCGQSAEPDHWKFRCMAREKARAALAAYEARRKG